MEDQLARGPAPRGLRGRWVGRRSLGCALRTGEAALSCRLPCARSWQFAKDFVLRFHAKKEMFDVVRRRRWVRLRSRRGAAAAAAEAAAAAATLSSGPGAAGRA